MPWAVAGAAVAAAGSVAGGEISSGASSAASKAQQQTSNYALEAQEQEDNQNIQNLQPYMNEGIVGTELQNQYLDSYNNLVTPALNQLTNLGNSSTAQAALAQTPGYQFTLQQGLQATQNAAAARGLGVSGAALKGAASYATGLADNTYQQQFGNALTGYNATANNFENQYNAASGMASLGENAAAQVGNTNQQGTANNTNLLTGLGNAQAAGDVGSANALSSGLSGVGSSAQSLGNNLLVQQYLNNSGSQYTNPGTTATNNLIYSPEVNNLGAGYGFT